MEKGLLIILSGPSGVGKGTVRKYISAKKAIEMSKSNKKLPHMHLDSKEEGRGSRKSRGSRGESEHSEHRERRRPEGMDGGKRREREGGRSKGGRPNVHTPTERTSSRKSNSASLYKKANKATGKKTSSKAERF